MTKRKLLIMEPFRNKNLEKIKQALKEDFFIKQLVYECATEELKREIIDAEIIIGQPPLALLQNPEVNCPQLKMIQMTWAGTDMYTRGDLSFPKGKIALANASGTYGMIMSQFVVWSCM